ncbi:carboxymuconolactone decarboxylase family protein [Plebeiibacterium sediminum]|uniref:Carboxymuconolactone decarboxylase family protein n=1 Tax=Plebeiibacterium sediminum TaxID=2992112 RepID=A0AAE3M9H2_9BACT|nr:carboxymuconolactone decarboxylase family protein [Plebeiobacterium sediminum]MCW3789294.1 carboxymuconolactone decarboxylase family protein [Plebeiobacterium sediminum]
MNRIELSKKKFEELFGNHVGPLAETDPDLQEMLNHFIFGEVFYHGELSDKLRELITLVVLTTNQTLDQLQAHVFAALNIGVSPVAIKEAIYQCVPYLGFPKTLNAIQKVNEVFKAQNITLPVESQKTVLEETRYEDGLKVQKDIFGDVIDQMHQNAPENQKHIQNYLSAFCFGDIYTRKCLDLKTRELLTLCILSALGGCENQVKSHVFGNLKVGNDKTTLLVAITQCLPYMGFPRTLNAISCINEVIPENK